MPKQNNYVGVKVSIKSFVNQKTHNREQSYESNFNFKDQMYCQSQKEEICKWDGKDCGIKLLSFVLTKPERNAENLDLSNFIFGTPLQKQLYKQYESVLSPDMHLQKRLLQNDYEQERSKDQQRIHYRRKLDQVRDQTEDRREQQKKIDQVRDKTEERKLRDQTEERRDQHKKIDQVRDRTHKKKL